jgi:UDP-N-acetylmuramate--alanine ligase
MGFLDYHHNIHVIGAGGIGLSAVAKLLVRNGCRVTGSDVRANEATAELAALGVPVVIGHDAVNLPADTDLVLFSDAVPPVNPERSAAAARGVPEMSYFDFLGALSRERRTVSVSGTNGKSTTTSLLGLMLASAGLDPTVVVGSRVAAFPDRNLRRGTGDLLVVESCEYRANMLKLAPQAVILTDIKEDHLDFFRDLDDIRAAFQKFVSSLPSDGLLVWNADDVESAKLEKPARAVSYGFAGTADYRAVGLAVGGGHQRFRVVRRGEDLGKFTLTVPGRFNVSNALAALAMAVELGAEVEAVRTALADYRGIWRRFEVVADKDGITVVSDYAHHPDAVAGTIAAAREFYPGRRIVACFQPHQRNRTRKLFSGFVNSLDRADVVLLPEIFDVAGREEEGESVSSRDLAIAVRERDTERGVKRPVEFVENPAAALVWFKASLRPGDVVLVMGAGDIYRIAPTLLSG